MKKITTLFLLLLSAVLFAQTPGKMSYQSVVRNAAGNLITTTNVGVGVRILQSSPTGNAVFSESHSADTNANGLLTLQIGGGVAQSGSFAGIDWADGPYFVEVSIDPSGGSNYTITGVSELMSVPYALYAANAPQGAQGPVGPQGPQGETGPQGPAGATGATGPQGPIGLTGATGSQGPIGLTGATGPQGPAGATGAAGPQGEAGAQGPIGLTGATGSQGPIGLTGVTGPQGPVGAIGATGPQGPIGLTGATGSQGPIGLTGATGSQGPIGLTGATGPQGPAGNDGATGAEGPQGPIGLTGATGPQGVQGEPGVQGIPGPQGPEGPLVAGSAGNVLYHNGTAWVALASGTAGQVLQSNGTDAPTWKTAITCYADRDGDGNGDKFSRFTSYDTSCPANFISNGNDCDDTNPNNATPAPTANAATGRVAASFTANWSMVSGATGYFLDVATNNNFSSMVSGYSNLSVGNVTTLSISGLDGCTEYFYRVRATGDCGTSANSGIVSSGTYNCATFNFTGNTQTFTVPTGVTSVSVQLYGARGGTAGGLGAYVSGTLSALVAGDVITVIVGGAGGASSPGNNYGGAGYGGGGNGRGNGGGGGGRSSLQINGSDVVTAGGGGGGSFAGSNGGAGGSGNGAAGGSVPGSSGSNGGGGGGGVSGSGAQGGASYTTNPAFSVTASTNGANNGHGKVLISWN